MTPPTRSSFTSLAFAASTLLASMAGSATTACTSDDSTGTGGGGGEASGGSAAVGGMGAGGEGGGEPATCSTPCPAHRTCLPEVDACVVTSDLGPSDESLSALFETIWTFYDESYGAFPIKDVDWASVRAQTLIELAEAPNRFWQLWAITRAVAAIGDGHTGAYSPDLCGATLGFGRGESNTGACVTEIEGRLVVYEASAESGLEVGDEVMAVDGRDVEAMLRDVLHQPRCAPAVSTAAQARWTAVDSVMQRPYEDGALTILRDGQELSLPFEPQAPRLCARILPPVVDVDHGSGVTSSALASGALYVRLPSFLSTDADGNYDPDPLIASLRAAFELAPPEGVILDVRSNPGGFPAVYMALASWLFDAPTDLFQCRSKTGPGHDDHGPPWTMTSQPDPTLQFDGPLALLVDARSFSAADFTYGWITETGRGRTFGHPSGGGFGNGNGDDAVAGPAFHLGVNDILCTTMAGEPLEGFPPPVDEAVALTEAGIESGVDDVIAAAEAWLAGP